MQKITRAALAVTAGAILAGSVTAVSANAATYPNTVRTSSYSRTATAQTWKQETKWTYASGDYNSQTNTEVRDNSGAGYNKDVTEWHPSSARYRTDTIENKWTAKGAHTFSNVWKYYG